MGREEGGEACTRTFERTTSVHAFGFPWRHMASPETEVVCFNVAQMAYYAAR